MNKKIIAITFITLMLLTAWCSVPAQPILQTLQKTKQKPAQEKTQVITDETAIEILSALTISDVITPLKQYLDTNPKSTKKTLLTTAMIDSTQEMQTLGITQETSLVQVKTKLGQLIQNRLNTKYHSYLVGFFPVFTTISTITPSVEINLTEIPTTVGNLTVKLEIFVKIIPFLDFVTIREIRPLRHGLTQTTKLWPAIGARITVEGITVFVVAFGPRIKWTTGNSFL
ncbi:MAG: hypothetical protein NT038_09375 [Euryarchaeota archaeon]|nr:hypothetical protein [Euryarchaeota archaeon]